MFIWIFYGQDFSWVNQVEYYLGAVLFSVNIYLDSFKEIELFRNQRSYIEIQHQETK